MAAKKSAAKKAKKSSSSKPVRRAVTLPAADAAPALESAEVLEAGAAPPPPTGKKAKKGAAKKGAAKKDKEEKPQTKAAAIETLRKRLTSKEVEVLAYSSDEVIGHVTGWISTQSIAIDKALASDGLPRGRLIEVYGPPDSGKTTFTDHVLKEVQGRGGVGSVVDTEEKRDIGYSKKIGVNVDELQVIQPKRKTFESVLMAIIETLDHWIENDLQHIPLVIVWDSIGGTPTEHAYENEDNDKTKVGGASKLLSEAMRRLMERLARSQATLVAVNHEYTMIGAFSRTPGPKKATYGGKAIRYHASMRIELIRIGQAQLNDKRVVGIKVLVRPFKNSVSQSLGSPQELVVIHGVGFDNYWPIFEKLAANKYVTSGGGWYTLGIQGFTPERFQNGVVGFADVCAKNPALFEMCATIYKALP